MLIIELSYNIFWASWGRWCKLSKREQADIKAKQLQENLLAALNNGVDFKTAFKNLI